AGTGVVSSSRAASMASLIRRRPRRVHGACALCVCAECSIDRSGLGVKGPPHGRTPDKTLPFAI
ncbi:hypothetical protein, partial [Gluconobacter sp. GP1]|uniref:hypothetical protein n=1 Tax=Gluconobacter sp. GP1 TaxID=3046423 RepID=UPI00293E6444